MHFIGIDPSAATFTASIYEASQFVAKPYTSESSAEGVTEFLAWLQAQGCTPENSVICIENTGVYSEILLYRIEQAGWSLVVAEPIKVHRAFGLGKSKTDELDSKKIAEYAARYIDKLTRWQPHEAVVEQIHVLLSTREQLVGQKTALLNTRHVLDRKYIQTPTANSSLEIVIKQLKKQITRLEKEIDDLIKKHPTLANTVSKLMSAPGVGLLLAANLLVITAGFKQSLNYRQLAAHLGIAPLARQSGTSVRGRSKSRGYGPPRTRKLLHLAARSLVTHVKAYQKYYARKMAQGKPKKLVLNNVANQLLRVLCSMIKNNKPYITEYVSLNPRLLVS